MCVCVSVSVILYHLQGVCGVCVCVCVCVCVKQVRDGTVLCVCVCVCERERERERDLFESEREKDSRSGWQEIWKADMKEVSYTSQYIWTFLSGTPEAVMWKRVWRTGV